MKRKILYLTTFLILLLFFVGSMFTFCGNQKLLSKIELQEAIASAKLGDSAAQVKLLHHYAKMSKYSDVYAVYRILISDSDYSIELERILSDPVRLKRFIGDCSIDDFCLSTDIYQHYYSIYQSLPDENKTALEQAITRRDNEVKTESCGFFASIRKFVTCGNS